MHIAQCGWWLSLRRQIESGDGSYPSHHSVKTIESWQQILPKPPMRKESWKMDAFTTMPWPSLGESKKPSNTRVSPSAVPAIGPVTATWSSSCRFVTMLVIRVMLPNDPNCKTEYDNNKKKAVPGPLFFLLDLLFEAWHLVEGFLSLLHFTHVVLIARLDQILHVILVQSSGHFAETKNDILSAETS